MVLVMALMSSAPAQAGWKDGDVTNKLPPNYTVKIATFTPPKPPNPPSGNLFHPPPERPRTRIQMQDLLASVGQI
jgi:hypothetical protein